MLENFKKIITKYSFLLLVLWVFAQASFCTEEGYEDSNGTRDRSVQLYRNGRNQKSKFEKSLTRKLSHEDDKERFSLKRKRVSRRKRLREENLFSEAPSHEEARVLHGSKRIKKQNSPEEKFQAASFSADTASSETLSVQGPSHEAEIAELTCITGFPEEVIAGTYSLGLPNPDLTVLMNSILNSSLYKEMRVSPKLSHPKEPRPAASFSRIPSKQTLKFDCTQVTPEKLDAYKKKGGNLNDLYDQIYQMKKERPSPIRNPDPFPKTDLHSPAARHGLSRQGFLKGQVKGFVKRLSFAAHVEPVTPLTEEELQELNESQRLLFLEAEKRRGKKPENLSGELEKEYSTWEDHLNYFEIRKNEIYNKEGVRSDEEEIMADDVVNDEDIVVEDEISKEAVLEAAIALAYKEKKVKRIRRLEIENTFNKYVAPKLLYLVINNYHVYFSKETLDLDRTNDSGETNRVIMKGGRCPIGPDGKLMNFHHLTHYDFVTHSQYSIIVLITDTLHKMYSRNLHFRRTTYQDLPKRPVTRSLFDPEREEFNKVIAELYDQMSL